jgi:hypothetical protein
VSVEATGDAVAMSDGVSSGVGVGVAVVGGAAVTVEVTVGVGSAAQRSFKIVLVSRVTAPFLASS